MAVLTCNFLSKSLGRMVPFNVVIPTANFSEMLNPDTAMYDDVKPFRTLYLLHGVGGNYTDWIQGTSIVSYAEANRLAVVMPSADNSFYTNNDGANRYADYIGDELVKVTRSMFNLSKNREDTFIAGLSMGGFGALRNGLGHSQVFSRIIALSSALVTDRLKDSTEESPVFFGRRSYFERVFGSVEQFEGSENDLFALAEKHGAKMKIYMACGTEDSLLDTNRKYAEFLGKQNIDCVYEEASGGHDWVFWDAFIKKGIEWLGITK